ncbi:MAG: Increased rDNA silencing protein [Claussenomyces sp. TS43310]|nr:MAG: Increased rDNA silencing protein [Claussenomyces sp. TS43310]
MAAVSIDSNSDSKSSKSSKNAPSTQGAALRGAAMAFGKPTIAPKPLPDTYTGRNGALAAATRAGRVPAASSQALLASHAGSHGVHERHRVQHRRVDVETGSSEPALDLHLVRQRLVQTSQKAGDNLKLPGLSSDRSRSPSQIAASLASSRSAPTSPNLTGQPPLSSPVHQRLRDDITQPQLSRHRIHSAHGAPADSLDTSPIPPTSSLIGIFERSKGTKPVITTRPSPIAVSKASPPEIQSPKPIRTRSLLLTDAAAQPLEHPRNRVGSSPDVGNRHLNLGALGKEKEEVSSDESFVSATDRQRPSPPQQRRRPPIYSTASYASTDDAATIDAMANAIVASSLAASRATSPTKSAFSRTSEMTRPKLPPRRRTPSLFHLRQHHQQQTQDQRTPSPAKGMRTTMRKPPKDDEEEDVNLQRTTKRNIIKKHPNKHHEGDRKRWRDSVTERERKRYEAVWASNKGRFLPPAGDATVSVTGGAEQTSGASEALRAAAPPKASEGVCNLVVRDIWSRSRLGSDALSEVWDLVDRGGRGYLSREEFVAGMWLIDQRLKGRKLPTRVGHSVWASVGGWGGVKVKGGSGRKGI